MRMQRLLATALGVALVASAPLAATANAAPTDDRGDDVAGEPTPTDNADNFAPADLDLDLGRTKAQRAAAPTIQSRVRATSKSKYKYKQKIKVKGAVQARPTTTTGGCKANTWCNIVAKGDKVYLLRKKAGAKKYKVIASKGPNSKGKFKFKTKSKGNAHYAIYYAGTSTVKPSSASKKIKGTRHPHLKVRARNGKVFMSADIAPGFGHKRVKVQRSNRAKGKYRTWAKPRTNKKGQFRIRLVAPRNGKWHYRLIIPKNSKKFAEFKSGSWGVYKRRR